MRVTERYRCGVGAADHQRSSRDARGRARAVTQTVRTPLASLLVDPLAPMKVMMAHASGDANPKSAGADAGEDAALHSCRYRR